MFEEYWANYMTSSPAEAMNMFAETNTKLRQNIFNLFYNIKVYNYLYLIQ